MAHSVGFIFLCGLVLISSAKPQEGDVLREFKRIRQLRSLGLQFAELFIDLTRNSTDYVSGEGDQKCHSDIDKLATGLQSGQYWALKMIDAWGSIPSGLLTGNLYDLGNFDECLSVREEINQTRTISGKYCFLTVSHGKVLGLEHSLAEPLKFNTATCFPASCSAAQMDAILGQLFSKVLNLTIPNLGMRISESSCQSSKNKPWDGLTIITVIILCLMSFLVALFTLYDYCLCENPSQLPTIAKVFSARANSRVLFHIVKNNSSPNVIDCLHGIRCLTLIWVVFCHQYFISLADAYINASYTIEWAEKPFTSFIGHAIFSVDSFFFLGGLLVALISLRLMVRTKGKLNVPLIYLHRLIRILPLLAISILVYVKLIPIISGGPLFGGGFSGREACESEWYWTVLFLNNFKKRRCLVHTWYLSVDMQLFLLSPILLISLYKWGKKAAAGIVILIVLLSGCLFATMLANNYSMLFRKISRARVMKVYFATHTHATPWLIGFLFGYFLHLNRNKKFQLSRVSVWSGWILCLAMIFTSIFALFWDEKWSASPLSTLAESFYYTLTRLAWPVALCWVVFACMQGYGGLANSFLSSPLWQPLSRLSFSVYMWHILFLEINAKSARTISYFSDYSQMCKFWSCFGFTVLLSYVMYLIIEAPFAGFDNFIRPRNMESKTK
ncbi:hypothetical protein KR059_012045, partial [Drosophila kikkawai]